MTSSFSERLQMALHVLRRGEAPPRVRVDTAPLSAEAAAEARSFFPLDKFFIFGHARSGTTMLARAVRLHPEVHCDYQAHFFTRPPLLEGLISDPEVAAWLKRGSNRWNRGEDLAPVVLRAAADFILEREARRFGKRIVGDKSPSSLMDGEAVRRMHKIYPDAALIYIYRDGRDTAVSHRFQTFIEFPERLSSADQRIRRQFAQNPELFQRGERSIFTESGLRTAAEGWVRNLQETDSLGRELYGKRYLSLRYEDLLATPFEQMCRVWSFLGAAPVSAETRSVLEAELASNPDAEWQQQKGGEIARALKKGQKGSWRTLFTPRDREIFRQTADATLLAWGYEATE